MDKNEIKYLELMISNRPVNEVRETLESIGYRFRIVKQDGYYPTVTRDYVRNRVNVNVEDGLVISIQGIG